MGAERTDQNTERQKFTGDLSFDWQQTVNKVPWTKWIHVHSNCYCLVGDLRSSRQTSWQYIRVQTTCPKKNIVQTSRHVFSPLSEYYQGNPFYTQGYGKRRKWWIKSYKWWTNGLKWWLRRRSTVTCVFSPRPICSKVKQNGFVPRKKRNTRNSIFFTFLMESVCLLSLRSLSSFYRRGVSHTPVRALYDSNYHIPDKQSDRSRIHLKK